MYIHSIPHVDGVLIQIGSGEELISEPADAIEMMRNLATVMDDLSARFELDIDIDTLTSDIDTLER